MSFDKLTKQELLRTLDEDFAFELKEEEKATKATIIAAITEGQLKFSDYLRANPDQAEKFKVEPQPVVTGESVVETLVAPPVEPTLANGMMVVDNRPVPNSAPWLMKMERQNSLYEVGRYRFSKEHPFVLVDAADVDAVLAEGGFRQATQNEASSYYG